MKNRIYNFKKKKKKIYIANILKKIIFTRNKKHLYSYKDFKSHKFLLWTKLLYFKNNSYNNNKYNDIYILKCIKIIYIYYILLIYIRKKNIYNVKLNKILYNLKLNTQYINYLLYLFFKKKRLNLQLFFDAIKHKYKFKLFLKKLYLIILKYITHSFFWKKYIFYANKYKFFSQFMLFIIKKILIKLKNNKLINKKKFKKKFKKNNKVSQINNTIFDNEILNFFKKINKLNNSNLINKKKINKYKYLNFNKKKKITIYLLYLFKTLINKKHKKLIKYLYLSIYSYIFNLHKYIKYILVYKLKLNKYHAFKLYNIIFNYILKLDILINNDSKFIIKKNLNQYIKNIYIFILNRIKLYLLKLKKKKKINITLTKTNKYNIKYYYLKYLLNYNIFHSNNIIKKYSNKIYINNNYIKHYILLLEYSLYFNVTYLYGIIWTELQLLINKHIVFVNNKIITHNNLLLPGDYFFIKSNNIKINFYSLNYAPYLLINNILTTINMHNNIILYSSILLKIYKLYILYIIKYKIYNLYIFNNNMYITMYRKIHNSYYNNKIILHIQNFFYITLLYYNYSILQNKNICLLIFYFNLLSKHNTYLISKLNHIINYKYIPISFNNKKNKVLYIKKRKKRMWFGNKNFEYYKINQYNKHKINKYYNKIKYLKKLKLLNFKNNNIKLNKIKKKNIFY